MRSRSEQIHECNDEVHLESISYVYPATARVLKCHTSLKELFVCTREIYSSPLNKIQFSHCLFQVSFSNAFDYKWRQRQAVAPCECLTEYFPMCVPFIYFLHFYSVQESCVCWSTMRSTSSRCPAPTPARSSLCPGWSWVEKSPSAVLRVATLPLSPFTPSLSMEGRYTGACF